MKKLIIITSILFLTIPICNASIKYKSLQIVQVKNRQVLLILDSMIECRKRCPSYLPNNLYFFIQKDQLSSKYTFEIDPFDLVSYLDNSNVCFIYRNHIVIIEKSVPRFFFIATPHRMQVRYNPDLIPSIYEPDVFRYNLVDGKFILDFKFCRCDKYN